MRAFHPHELVHAAAGRIGMPPAFFAEGLAVALSSGGLWRGRDVDAVAQGALVAGARLEPLFTEPASLARPPAPAPSACLGLVEVNVQTVAPRFVPVQSVA